MGRLHYTAITSLDGYVADGDGAFGWAAPDAEVHAFVNDLERPIGTHLYGRRLYEVMRFWETVDVADLPAPEHDYARIWRAADKVVFSSTLGEVSTARTRLERTFDPDAIRTMKMTSERDLTVGGAGLAAEAIRAGLVDEWHLFVVPVTSGWRHARAPRGGPRPARAPRPSSVRQRNGLPAIPHRDVSAGPGSAGGKMTRMRLPVMPPVSPMLARSVAEIPSGDYLYEPKWDGFRSIVFRDGDEVEIGSRNERPMTRYFPEVVDAVRVHLPERCVVDGEIVVPDPTGTRLEFETLQQRIHPADSRVRLLAKETPAHLVAFDLLALGDRDLMREPFAERRRLLEERLAEAVSPIHVTPATIDRDVAGRWFEQFEGAGLDGVIAKPHDATYQPGKRAMFKVKHIRTADCVVAGYRVHKSDERAIGSLLLGLYDEKGDLQSVGVVGAFPMAQRRKLFEELQPLVTTSGGHPWDRSRFVAETRTPRSSELSRWSHGKDLSFTPLRPERVIEVRYDHMEGSRFRHTTQFVRWRPDRDPRSCTFEQLEGPVRYDLAEILGSEVAR